MGLIEAVAIFGVLLSLFGVVNVVKIQARKKWPTTICKVGDSDVEVSEVVVHNLLSKQRNMNSYRSKSYSFKLNYLYNISGKNYLGTTIFSGSILGQTHNDMLPYTNGSTHTVWYNPAKPTSVFLKHSSVIPSIVLIVLGLLIVVGGLWPELYAELYSHAVST
ncbi:Protein of unknown function [Alteromonadaceae bacterium Bs31]|nr:Protein of unknown function [Alteromonadaceae bacterium Bs31]